MIDSFGRKWSYDENELDKIIKSHNLHLNIEYRTVNDRNPITGSKVKYFMEIKDKMNRVIIDYNDFNPLSDSEILLMLKECLRNKKIDDILK